MATAIIRGDARRLPLPDGCVDLVVTSPPYFGLRSYTDGGEHYGGQIGSEATPAEWLAAMVECTREMVRVLKPEGSIFINLGDSYARLGQDKPQSFVPGDVRKAPRQRLASNNAVPLKSLNGLPWRYALACTDQLGLILRRDIIWAKPNGLPESVTDRCRSAHEYVFHLVRQPRYYSAVDEIREPQTRAHLQNHNVPEASRVNGGRRLVGAQGLHDYINPLGKLPGSVWTIPSQPLTVPASLGIDHFAAFPVELPRRIVLGWSPPGVCVECGQGRRPVVDKTPEYHRGNGRTGLKRDLARMDGQGSAMFDKIEYRDRATITGYACACPTPDAPSRPALVLDPFAGTGTTLLAAAAYGRHAIGIDRSADYCRLARWRVNDPGERAKAMQVPKPPPVTDGQDALFVI